MIVIKLLTCAYIRHRQRSEYRRIITISGSVIHCCLYIQIIRAWRKQCCDLVVAAAERVADHPIAALRGNYNNIGIYILLHTRERSAIASALRKACGTKRRYFLRNANKRQVKRKTANAARSRTKVYCCACGRVNTEAVTVKINSNEKTVTAKTFIRQVSAHRMAGFRLL